MRHGGKYIPAFLFFLLLCSHTCLQAQVKVLALVDKDSILIGQPAFFSLEVYAPPDATIEWPAIDSIFHFEVLDRQPVDTLEGNGGKHFAQTLSITGFEPGNWTMTPFSVMVDGVPYYSDSIRLNVVLAPFDPGADYRDIKDIVEIPADPPRYIVPALLALGLVSLLLLYLLLRRKKQAQQAAPAPPVSPYEEAMNALSGLAARIPADGEEKKYYTAMNDVLKIYLSRRFAIPATEKTNEELMLQLCGFPLARTAFLELSQTLTVADFVKFAKFRPSPEDHRAHLAIIRMSIKKLDNLSPGAL